MYLLSVVSDTSTLSLSTGSAPGTPKLITARPPQKVKATVANIPVGSYDGGGRGKERDKERDREKEREREKDKDSGSQFTFEIDKASETNSPAAVPLEEGTGERTAHPAVEGGATGGHVKEANAKEVRHINYSLVIIVLNVS